MGGGAMRTAAKAAVLGGYRSAGSFADQAPAAARRAARPPTASVSAASVANPASAISHEASALVSPSIGKLSWEIDDWEFAGGKEDELFNAVHPAPRFVFGPVPTLEEAKEAISELKEALNNAYFSSGKTDGQESKSLEPIALENSEAKVYIGGGNAALLPCMPKNVVQAFSLLREPEAQDVVASLASDKNVWDAVMKNEKVMAFYGTHQSNESIDENEVAKSVDGNEIAEVSSQNTEDMSPEEPSERSENKINVFMQNVKTKVSELVNSLSDFFQDFLGTPAGGHSSMGMKTTSSSNYVEAGIGASFIALAIAAIMVVLVKRG